MRTIARILAGVVGLAAAATLFAQYPVGDLNDLIGVRGRHGDTQIRERGYTLVRTVENGANEFSYWREGRSGRCVSVRSAKNRYAAFSYVPDAECDGGSGQIGYGGSASGYSGSHGVTLHRGVNFTGVSEAFTSDVPNLRSSRIGDDQATSVSVSRGCRARFYEQPNYQGRYLEVTSSIGDLRDWKAGVDSVTSLRVRCDGVAWSDDRSDEAVPGASSGGSGVTLHRDLNFAGVSEAFTSDVPDLRVTRIGDDHATSVSVSRGCRARLYQHLNFEGAYTEVSSGVGDLRGSKVGDDSATSLQVRCDGWGWNDDRADVWGNGASSASRGVTLYRDPKFAGISEAFASDVPDLRVSRIGDDQATSVSVSRGCQARLYPNLNYEGAYTEVNSSMTDLRGSKVGDDSATSLKVRCDH
jgi:hypothetical protein